MNKTLPVDRPRIDNEAKRLIEAAYDRTGAALELRRNTIMRKAVAYMLTACLALYGAFLFAHSNIESVHAQEGAPQLNSIGPDTVVAGTPTFTLRAEGRRFEDGVQGKAPACR